MDCQLCESTKLSIPSSTFHRLTLGQATAHSCSKVLVPLLSSTLKASRNQKKFGLWGVERKRKKKNEDTVKQKEKWAEGRSKYFKEP